MAYVLGVDGGGSKTLVVVGDDRGEVLGIGRAGPANHQGAGVSAAMHEVRSAALKAFTLAGIRAPEVDVAAYCLAGADFPEDFALLTPPLEDLKLARRAQLLNDMAAALRSGTDKSDAVVVGWGSGVNAFGRNAEGGEVRLPALGWYSGDWGGGSDLGREAIFLVARAHDGRGEQTALRELVLEALEVPNVDEMIRKLYFRDGARVELHRLAPLVFQAANAGDPVSCVLVERASEEVATTALALMRRLDLLDRDTDVVLAGGIFRAEGAMLLRSVEARLRKSAPLAHVLMPDTEPVIGAFLHGIDMLGQEAGDDVHSRARESYKRLAAQRMEVGET